MVISPHYGNKIHAFGTIAQINMGLLPNDIAVHHNLSLRIIHLVIKSYRIRNSQIQHSTCRVGINRETCRIITKTFHMIHNDMDNEIHILTVAGGAKHHLGVGFLFGLSFELQIPAFQNRREGILIRVGKQ